MYATNVIIQSFYGSFDVYHTIHVPCKFSVPCRFDGISARIKLIGFNGFSTFIVEFAMSCHCLCYHHTVDDIIYVSAVDQYNLRIFLDRTSEL